MTGDCNGEARFEGRGLLYLALKPMSQLIVLDEGLDVSGAGSE